MGMINPGLDDKRSYTVHDDNCIIVLGCHSEYESIDLRCKVFADKNKHKMINRKY